MLKELVVDNKYQHKVKWLLYIDALFIAKFSLSVKIELLGDVDSVRDEWPPGGDFLMPRRMRNLKSGCMPLFAFPVTDLLEHIVYSAFPSGSWLYLSMAVTNRKRTGNTPAVMPMLAMLRLPSSNEAAEKHEENESLRRSYGD